ncbi:LysR family transcriptional regulator [Paenalcaligenes niemegkensis]|uniref:LysR family transcriptional regulator n=1 Tax=Paenalcaligenes niemegkensis TaxID=2895469 RepID=UPI001EE7D3D0|nr:LysR family transcriptional regulator [Paenalcaligenes niemegkensis]MCQ9617913.1 LysR family transcriptional regulator [Paenalcaligenes niemegkensis]
MRLRDVDLNLLILFDALIKECHVTRAAQRMDISQSSMSGALAKLRTIFDDPLLVRSQKGLVATPRAKELALRVEQLLGEIDSLINEHRTFEPLGINDTISMIVIDYIDFVVIPNLIQVIEERAPGLSLRVLNPNPRRLSEIMSTGEADMALTYFPAPPENVRTRRLFNDRLVGMARADHPIFDQPLDLDRFCQFDHVALEPGEGATMYNEIIDGAIERQGHQRRVALSKPTFMGVPFLVSQTNLIATLPERIAERFTDFAPIRLFEIPLELEPINVVLMWHDRTHTNPVHRWLREQIIEVTK